MKFRYKDYMGNEFELTEKTLTPYVLEDQGEEKLLYSRHKPAYAAMLDSLPSSASINAHGKIEPSPLIRVIFLMFLPLLTIVGHGIYVFNTYVG